MRNLLTISITKFLRVVEICSSSVVVQWVLRILALSQAIRPAGWPPHFKLEGGDTFDFIVVGSGSGGAVVAARLSESPHVRVLLIEAGDDPPLASVIPSLFVTLTKTEYDWDYSMKFDGGLGQAHTNQMVNLIRGKMLGGSSSLNYEVYIRGEPRDYDEWSETAPGWDWDAVLPYFKKLENMTDHTIIDNPYNAHLHSTDGPVKVSRPRRNDYFDHVNNVILSSYQELGLKKVLEANGNEHLGVSVPHYTYADGRRSSTAESYLRPAKGRPNLYVAKYTRALKLLIDHTSRINGVQVLHKTGRKINVYSNYEVILSAGSIDTPKLLMLSGIGPKEELDRHHIKTIVDLPVGKNLQDHAFIPLVFPGEFGIKSAFQHIISLTDLAGIPIPTQNGFFTLNKTDNRRQFQIFNVHVGALAFPAVQFGCEIVSYNREFCASVAKVNVWREIDATLLILLHPLSRGRVRLKSNNPLDDPIIENGYLRNKNDIRLLTDGLKFIKGLEDTTYYKNVGAKLEKLDVRGCDHLRRDEDYWTCYVRNAVGSLQHPAGTCAMGPEGVVDEKLRVHGVSGLRVVDASVMPKIPGGNTNAPTMMIGEKAADMIKEEYGFLNDLNKIHNIELNVLI